MATSWFHTDQNAASRSGLQTVLPRYSLLATHHLLLTTYYRYGPSLRTICRLPLATCYTYCYVQQVQSFTSLYDQDEDSGAFVVVCIVRSKH